MNKTDIPMLEGEAAEARDYRGGHMQVIASAGSGKTETVSQRVAALIAEGVEPAQIVAFTFTKRAAAELKDRIRARVELSAGEEQANRLGNMYVGTIHGFCFQMLSKYVSSYESYDVVDDNQLTALILRYQNRLDMTQFSATGKLYKGMSRFLENLAVVENEMLDLSDTPAEFAETARTLYELLEQHRLLTYGLQISKAVEILQDGEIRVEVSGQIKHLIVDEYQDVNPAQERLIQLLSKPNGGADLVVVGDDDQAIYQWRGSSVANITTFANRYENVKTFSLLKNRRSRPGIVDVSDRFARSIPGRLEKEMSAFRNQNGPALDIVLDYATEAEETSELAASIQALRRKGFLYSEMAVLVRGRASYEAILKAFETAGIPVQPGDRSGLFDQVDADFLGRTFAWLSDDDWKASQYANTREQVDLASLERRAKNIYSLTESDWNDVKTQLEKIKAQVGSDSRNISLVEFGYEITGRLGVKDWNLDDPIAAARMGTIARFMKFVSDYEAMNKKARISSEENGRQIGVSDKKAWYFRNFSNLMLNYALGEYRDFEGEDDILSDSVELMTVHAAKGLEWPIVFLPSLTNGRFPGSKTGSKKDWIVSTSLFDTERYEGSDGDERRLFYVAMTRAREWLALSAHEKVKVQRVKISPYIKEVHSLYTEALSYPADWVEPRKESGDSDLQITYSEIADYLNCGLSYWLRNRIGFPPAIIEEIGYGNAVHHLMRAIAEETTRKKRQLTPIDVDRLLATDFFLPFAGKAVSDRFRESARKLIFNYLSKHAEEMGRVWQTERPFELALPGVVVTGRADVVLDRHDGKPDSLAILDYKTSVGEQDFGLQLQIYTEAGIREGLEIRGAFVHDMKAQDREAIDTSAEARKKAVEIVLEAVDGIKNRDFKASPAVHKCGICDVRAICRSSLAPKVRR